MFWNICWPILFTCSHNIGCNGCIWHSGHDIWSDHLGVFGLSQALGRIFCFDHWLCDGMFSVVIFNLNILQLLDACNLLFFCVTATHRLFFGDTTYDCWNEGRACYSCCPSLRIWPPLRTSTVMAELYCLDLRKFRKENIELCFCLVWLVPKNCDNAFDVAYVWGLWVSFEWFRNPIFSENY